CQTQSLHRKSSVRGDVRVDARNGSNADGRLDAACLPRVAVLVYGSAMDAPLHVAGIAPVIQAAVAPVFLLAGVAGTLNVLATRIGRIIDRARLMEDRLPTASAELAHELHARLRLLSRRATLVNRAIALCVLCGLL